jgi:S1-C subfamily serine protease
MPSVSDWQISPSVRPKPGDYSFDLQTALASVVSLRAIVPDDAFTADVLGTERSGTGVFIRQGVVLTIGYLITEAESVWLNLSDGRTVPGHVLGYDQETGFGLVQALARVDIPVLPLGTSAKVDLGERVVIGGAGGLQRSVAARIVAKQEFAGYWGYLLDEALFAAPAHPYWGGTALIGPGGDLLGIGSLRLEQSRDGGRDDHLNMIVPIDLLKPVLNDLLTIGRPNRPPQPWLGLYATEVDERVVVVGLADNGPAERAGLQSGDVILAVAGRKVGSLAAFFRTTWKLGNAGVEVPLLVYRDGETSDVRVTSADRNAFLKAPKLH